MPTAWPDPVARLALNLTHSPPPKSSQVTLYTPPAPSSILPPPFFSLTAHTPCTHLQGVTDERELKRLRRKQSNRESARRSRLRKQAECEALARQVKDLITGG